MRNLMRRRDDGERGGEAGPCSGAGRDRVVDTMPASLHRAPRESLGIGIPPIRRRGQATHPGYDLGTDREGGQQYFPKVVDLACVHE